MAACYGYIRYSPTGKADGASMEVQQRDIERWVELKGLRLANVFADEAISGKSLDKRKELGELLRRVKRGDTVIVYSLSRLARNTLDACTLADTFKNSGVSLVVLDLCVDTSTPMGACFFQIAAAFAELERKQIAERTSVAMRQHQSNGRKMSRYPPYGWSFVGKELEQDPKEQMWLRKIRRWRKDGHTFYWIAKHLNDLGVEPRGETWYRQTVQRVLERDMGYKERSHATGDDC